MTRDAKLEALRSVPLFDGLSRNELAELARAGDEVDLQAGKVLTAEGAVGSEFFVLLQGEAPVSPGGQGAGLAEMTQLGIPVPAGFTISTDACRAYMDAGKRLPDGLEEEVDEHLRRLEERTGKRFGDPRDPLLVSVRSGAAVSMPGMMDTILTLGLNEAAVEGLAARTGNRGFAFDRYRRPFQMYGERVDGIAHDR